MSITWSIDKITTIPVCGDLTNVVTDVDWRCTATEGETSQSTYGRASFTGYNEEDFTEYDDLTEEAVVEWVKQSLGESGVSYNERLATTRVNAALNPFKKENSLPW